MTSTQFFNGIESRNRPTSRWVSSIEICFFIHFRVIHFKVAAQDGASLVAHFFLSARYLISSRQWLLYEKRLLMYSYYCLAVGAVKVDRSTGLTWLAVVDLILLHTSTWPGEAEGEWHFTSLRLSVNWTSPSWLTWAWVYAWREWHQRRCYRRHQSVVSKAGTSIKCQFGLLLLLLLLTLPLHWSSVAKLN